MQVLPAMCADPNVAAFALRALQPLLSPKAPLTLQCLALSLLTDTWLKYGKGWHRVEAALSGYAKPGSEPPVALRLTRAALVLKVCRKDEYRGLELIAAIQVQ